MKARAVIRFARAGAVVRRRLFPVLCAAALFLCVPSGGRRAPYGGPALVGAASAQDMPPRRINDWGDGEEFEENPVYRFLKTHGKAFFFGLPAAMLILYVVLMGPGDVGNALRYSSRRNRFGGFGSNGGFGGRP